MLQRYEFIDDSPLTDEELLAPIPRGLTPPITTHVPRAERLAALMDIHGNALGFVEWCAEQAARIETLARLDVQEIEEAVEAVRDCWGGQIAARRHVNDYTQELREAVQRLRDQSLTFRQIGRLTQVPLRALVMAVHPGTQQPSAYVELDEEIAERGLVGSMWSIHKRTGIDQRAIKMFCDAHRVDWRSHLDQHPTKWSDEMVADCVAIYERTRSVKAAHQEVGAKYGVSDDDGWKYQSAVACLRRAGHYGGNRKAAA